MISGEQMPTNEIRQTRDGTDAEAKRMSHFAAYALYRETRRDRVYWVFKTVAWGGMIAAFLIFVDFARSNAGAAFPVWTCIAVLIGIAGYFAMLGRAQRVAARQSRDAPGGQSLLDHRGWTQH